MNGTEVLTARLLEVAQRVEENTQRYNAAVDKVYQIGMEIDAMWDGEASQKFMYILGNDRPRFDVLTKILNVYINTLRQDVGIYEKAEYDVLNVVSSNKFR